MPRPIRARMQKNQVPGSGVGRVRGPGQKHPKSTIVPKPGPGAANFGPRVKITKENDFSGHFTLESKKIVNRSKKILKSTLLGGGSSGPPSRDPPKGGP